jgi:shikimate 5-dehydrogenase
VVLGSGGAALAAVVACRRAGARRVYVTARKWQEEVPVADWAKVEDFLALGAIPCAWGTAGNPRAETLVRALKDADLIVQSTSAGMLGVGQGEVVRDVIPWGALNREVFLYDVVYNPARTPFLKAATDAGLNAEGGLSMLVLQAALGFELWLGTSAPLEPMKSAAERALYRAVHAEVAP